MTWVRIDDNLAYHPKVIPVGNPAMGAWVRCASWCGLYLTDGFVPKDVAEGIADKRKDIDGLVDVGLWLPAPGGYQFHQWLDRNPSREQVEAERDASRKRVQRWREQRRRDDGTFGEGTSSE
jgi:hypothetical protein